jgi:hypothetical protein
VVFSRTDLDRNSKGVSTERVRKRGEGYDLTVMEKILREERSRCTCPGGESLKRPHAIGGTIHPFLLCGLRSAFHIRQ